MPRFVVNMRKSSIRSQKVFLTISLTSSWNSKINREPLTNHHGIRMGTNSSRKKGGKKENIVSLCERVDMHYTCIQMIIRGSHINKYNILCMCKKN